MSDQQPINSRQEFSRDLAALDALFAFIERHASVHSLNEEVRYTLNLVAEELFTNMVKYSPSGDSHVSVELVFGPERVTMKFVDSGVEPFDPRSTRPRDFDQPAQKRRPGGLGVHLVKQLVDEFHYDYRDGESTITVSKRLSQPDV